MIQTQPRRGLQQQSTRNYSYERSAVQCRNLKCRNVKKRYLKCRKCKDWKRKYEVNDWFVGSESGGFFWGLPCYLYSSRMTIELHFKPSNCSSMIAWSCCLRSSSTMPLLAVRLSSYIWIWMWVTVEATSPCISSLIQCYLDHARTNINRHVYDHDRRLNILPVLPLLCHVSNCNWLLQNM